MLPISQDNMVVVRFLVIVGLRTFDCAIIYFLEQPAQRWLVGKFHQIISAGTLVLSCVI